MTTHIIAVAENNSTFAWTMDFSQVAAAYPAIASSVVRMQIKTNRTDAAALFEFATVGALGAAVWNGAAQTVQFLAAQSLLYWIAGQKYFDIRIETAGVGEFVCAYGTITFESGPTASGSGQNFGAATGIPDTVIATTWETIVGTGPLPVSINSLTAVLASATTEAGLAAASATSAASSASVAAAIAATTWAVWPTRAAFAAATIGAAITAVRVLGYSNPGDGGEAVYSKLGAAPGTVLAGHVRTADGAWWQMGRATLYAPEAFGAAASSADNTAAVNAAIVFLQAEYGGGQLHFGAAIYTFLGTIVIPPPGGVTLFGASNKSTYLVFGAGTADCITIGTSGGALTLGVIVQNLAIDGSRRTGGRALYAATTFWTPYIRDVVFYDAWNGVELYGCNGPYLENTLFQRVHGSWGIYWHGSTTVDDSPGLTINNVVVSAGWFGADGMWVDGSAKTLNVNVLTLLDCRVGLWVKNTVEQQDHVPAFFICFNLVTDGMALRGMQIDGGREMYFTDCWIQNTSTPGAGAFPGAQGFNDQEAILIQGDVGFSYTSDIHFTNCRMGNTKQNAVTLSGAPRNIKFNGCLIEPGSKAGANTYDGIYIGPGAQDISVNDCDFLDWGDPVNWRYGVNVQAGTFRILCEGNNFNGVQTAPFFWANTDSFSRIGSVMVPTAAQGVSSGISGKVTPQGTTTGGITLTAQNMLGGVLQLGGSPGAAFTDTTPTAAQLVAALNNPYYFVGLPLLCINSTGQAATLAAGTGVTFAGNLAVDDLHIVIAASSQRFLMLVFTGTAPGAEAVTIYG